LVVVSGDEDEDVVFDAAIEAGAQDVQKGEGADAEGSEGSEGYRVLTSLEDYAAVQSSLIAAGLKVNVEDSGLVYVPLVTKGEDEVNDEDYDANEALFERLLEVDDVDAVYKNY
jgi:transcriptional/translational regulatory protein YebC/TACO1